MSGLSPRSCEEAGGAEEQDGDEETEAHQLFHRGREKTAPIDSATETRSADEGPGRLPSPDETMLNE